MGDNIKPGPVSAGLVDNDQNLNPQIPPKFKESPKPSKGNVSPSKQITLSKDDDCPSKQITPSKENDIPKGGTNLADKLPQPLVTQTTISKANVGHSKQITPSKQNVSLQKGTLLADKLPQLLVKSPKPSKPNVSTSKQITPSNLNVNLQKLVKTPHNPNDLVTKPTNTNQKQIIQLIESLHVRLKEPEKLTCGAIGTKNLATETPIQATPLTPNKQLSKANQIISTNHPLIHSDTKEEMPRNPNIHENTQKSTCSLKPPPVVKAIPQECAKQPSSSNAKTNLIAQTAQRISRAIQKASNYARKVNANLPDQVCPNDTRNEPTTTPPLSEYEDPQTSLARILFTESDIASDSDDESTVPSRYVTSEYRYSKDGQPKQYLDSLENAATQILNLIGKLNSALETDTDSISLTSVQSQLNNLHTKLLDQSNNRKLKSNSRTNTRRDSNVLLNITTKNVNEVKEEQVIDGGVRTIRKKDVSQVLEKVIRNKTNKEDVKTLKFIVRPDGMVSSGSASDKATTNIHSSEHDRTGKPVRRVSPSSPSFCPVACSSQITAHQQICQPHKSANIINNCNSGLQKNPNTASSNMNNTNFCNMSQQNQSQLMGQTCTRNNADQQCQSNPSNISHAQKVQPILRNTYTTLQTSHPDCAVCNQSKFQSTAVPDVQQCSYGPAAILETPVSRTKHDLSQCYLACGQSLPLPANIDFNNVNSTAIFPPNTNYALANMPTQYYSAVQQKTGDQCFTNCKVSTQNITPLPVCVPSFEIVDAVCNNQIADCTNLEDVTTLDYKTMVDYNSANDEGCINTLNQSNLDQRKVEQQHDLNQTQAIFDLILESYQNEPFDLPVVQNFFNMINGLKGKLAWNDLFLCLIDNIEQFSAVKIFDRRTFQEVGHFNLTASEMEEVYACGLIELFQYARNRNLERDPNAHKSITPIVAQLIYKDLQRPVYVDQMNLRSCIVCCRHQNKWERLESCVSNLVRLVEDEQQYRKFHGRPFHVADTDCLIVPSNTPADSPFKIIRKHQKKKRILYSRKSLEEIKNNIERSTRPLTNVKSVMGSSKRKSTLRPNYETILIKNPKPRPNSGRMKTISIVVRPSVKHKLWEELTDEEPNTIRITENDQRAMAVFRDPTRKSEWD